MIFYRNDNNDVKFVPNNELIKENQQITEIRITARKNLAITADKYRISCRITTVIINAA